MRERETERKSELAPASFKQHASQKVTKNFLSLLFFFRQQKSSLCLCLYSHLQISFRLYHFKILDFCRFFKIAIILSFFQIVFFLFMNGLFFPGINNWSSYLIIDCLRLDRSNNPLNFRLCLSVFIAERT
jgi:hypothetical protein